MRRSSSPALDAWNTTRPERAPASRYAELEQEVARLTGRCRAREHALEHLSVAVTKLRRANGALSEENSLLRLEVERLQAREAARSR
jgi:chromosome segregation ATPase